MATDDQEVISLLADESFQRWLSGSASETEARHWQDWLNAAPHHRELFTQARELWSRVKFQQAILPDVESELQKLQRRLDLPTTKTATIRDLSSRRTLQSHEQWMRFSWLRFGAAAAAAAVLMVVLWRFFPFSSNHTDKTKFQFVATDYGQRTRIQLPEGTVIILNAKSTLRYPAVWTDATERRIDLHGEAYFEAASRPEGPQHDLIVQTNDGTVKVVGTRFVVYERGQGTRVVVEEGGVMVTVADTNASQTAPATQALLNPGHLLQFQKGSRDIAPKSVNSGIYTSWWREHLELEGAPFGQVIRRLEETYGIRIEVEDESLLQRTLSGSIENRNLEVITEALAKALSTTVRRKGQVVVFGKLAAE